MLEITIYDLLLTPFYLILIFYVTGRIQKKQRIKDPIYKWYTKGVLVKIIGAIAVCLIYQFYYSGGDTINYFITSRAILNMAFKDFGVFVEMMIGNNSIEIYNNFDINTGWPELTWRDNNAIFVARLLVPFVFLSFKTFIPSTLLLAWLCYSGVWRLFKLFCIEFKPIERQLTISILFVPSVVFWGSGLLKDTITLAAIGWFAYNFYFAFIKKEYKITQIGFIFIAVYLLISIKPYIFFALLPGSLVWLGNQRLENVSNKLLKYVAGPTIIAMGLIVGFIILGQMGDRLGVYAVDKVLDKARESNIDQKQEYYGGSSFDIGSFEPTVGGALSKAHLAITATLFRPFIWEARNPVMLLSGLENTYILILTLLLLLRLKGVSFFNYISKSPLLLFSMLFAFFFAFAVGLATSNFGTLVRLKIPCIPFFVSGLFVIRHMYEKNHKKKLGI